MDTTVNAAAGGSDSGNGNGNAQSPPQAPQTRTPANQMGKIAAFNQTYKNTTSSIPIQKVNLIVTGLQLFKILWLALQGVPCRSIAFEVRADFEKLTSGTKPEKHVDELEKFIALAIGSIARGGDPDPDVVVANVMACANQNFDRKGLDRAMEHALLDDGGAILAGKGERQALRRGHGDDEKYAAALSRWRMEVGFDIDPDIEGAGKGFPKKIKALAINGLGLERLKRKIEDKLGYDDGDVGQEKAALKERLVKIRRDGTIARMLED